MRPHHPAAPQPTPDLAGRGPADPFALTVPAGIGAPAAARAGVSAWMADRVSETLRRDVLLLMSELVANSVRHADTPADAVITVRAYRRGDVLCLDVEDRGNGASITRRAPDLQSGGGFGLNVVEALSQRWGVNRDAGTRVWAELACPEAGRAPMTREPDPHGDMSERSDAARAARARADDARKRARAAREAADHATTEYARRAHSRVAAVHAELALNHDDFARTLRRSDGDPEGD
jgi:anti-sigma regulatory factor (Ser/Thr protein kinase)